MRASPPSRKVATPRAKLQSKKLVGFRRSGASRGATKSGQVKPGITKGGSVAGITKPVLL